MVSLWWRQIKDPILIAMWRQVIDRYLGEARAALAAAAQQETEDGDDAAAAALGLVNLVLEMSPRAEAALELRARALLALRRYRDVADMLRDYIPSCVGKSCSGSGDNATTSSSSCSSGVGRESKELYAIMLMPLGNRILLLASAN